MKQPWISTATVDEISAWGTLTPQMSGIAGWCPRTSTRWSWESYAVMFKTGLDQPIDPVVKRLVQGWRLVDRNHEYVELRIAEVLRAMFSERATSVEFKVTHVLFVLSTIAPGSLAVSAYVSISLNDDVSIEVDLIDPDNCETWSPLLCM